MYKAMDGKRAIGFVYKNNKSYSWAYLDNKTKRIDVFKTTQTLEHVKLHLQWLYDTEAIRFKRMPGLYAVDNSSQVG